MPRRSHGLRELRFDRDQASNLATHLTSPITSASSGHCSSGQPGWSLTSSQPPSPSLPARLTERPSPERTANTRPLRSLRRARSIRTKEPSGTVGSMDPPRTPRTAPDQGRAGPASRSGRLRGSKELLPSARHGGPGPPRFAESPRAVWLTLRVAWLSPRSIRHPAFDPAVFSADRPSLPESRFNAPDESPVPRRHRLPWLRQIHRARARQRTATLPDLHRLALRPGPAADRGHEASPLRVQRASPRQPRRNLPTEVSRGRRTVRVPGAARSRRNASPRSLMRPAARSLTRSGRGPP